MTRVLLALVTLIAAALMGLALLSPSSPGAFAEAQRPPSPGPTLPPPAAGPPKWHEDATRFYLNRELHIPWKNSQGDFVDADGRPQGSDPFATARLRDTDSEQRVVFDVTRLVREHGADFRVHGPPATFASRESESGGPVLRVTRNGQTRELAAAADTTMDPSTVRSLGKQKILKTRPALMVRFDQPADPAIAKAELVLTSLKQFGSGELKVFRPVTDAAVGAVETPPALAASARGAPARVLANWTGRDFKEIKNTVVEGDVATAWFEGARNTATSQFFHMPEPREEAYLTVVMRIHPDWDAPGGKLPGFSNTGAQPQAEPCVVDGKSYPNGGWGGRQANACRWSARTGFWGARDDHVGLGTYFYALKPNDVNGIADYFTIPVPKGRWVAYVQRVKLNTPGRADGELSYWLVADGRARGGKPVQHRENIIWRDVDVPQSRIQTVWANVFCGGRDCGPKPWPRYTMSMKRLTVTDRLPDLAQIQAELDRLNAGGQTARR